MAGLLGEAWDIGVGVPRKIGGCVRVLQNVNVPHIILIKRKCLTQGCSWLELKGESCKARLSGYGEIVTNAAMNVLRSVDELRFKEGHWTQV